MRPSLLVNAILGLGVGFFSQCAPSTTRGNSSNPQSLLELAPAFKDGRNKVLEGRGGQDGFRWLDGPARKFRLTGVAYDSPRTSTLISPVHVLMSTHFKRGVGDVITFHDRDGKPHSAKIAKVINAPRGLDLSIGRLERPIPVPFYPVLPPSAGHSERLLLEPILVTNQHGGIHINSWLEVRGRFLRMGRNPFLKPSWRLGSRLSSGDSGNPSFLWQDGEMILISLHTFGGYGRGPFVSDPQVFAILNEMMKQIGGGHRLKTRSYEPVRPGEKPPYLSM